MAEIDTTELHIGNEPQYFFDDGIIESVHNLTRTLHSPERIDANPIIRSDRSWEYVTYFTANGSQVWRDTSTGRFHCLYQSWRFNRDKRAPGTSLVGWPHSHLRQCYAYSDDGARWVKPPMGIQEEDGHDTNIVFGSETFGTCYSMYGVENPFEEDPAKRFKAIYTHVAPGKAGASVKGAAYSADCIHWTPYDQVPTFGKMGGRLGDVFQGAFDPVSRTYTALTRHSWMCNAPHTSGPSADLVMGGPAFDIAIGPANRRNRRRIFQIESSDFMNWSEPRAILAPDPEIDNLDDALYSMTPMWLGGQWLGFINMFHMVSNTFTVQLAHSRDGKHWRRVEPGRTWLGRGPAGSWEQFMVSISSPPLVVGDEMWVYYGGAKNHHDWWVSGEGLDVPEARGWDHVGYALGLAKTRKDGFISIGANEVREGMLETQPFGSSGNRLIINAACGPGGYIKTEVVDQLGNVLPGNGLDDCDVFSGDSVRQEVTWKGDATALVPGGDYDARTYRRLRFVMRNAELYSFRMGQ